MEYDNFLATWTSSAYEFYGYPIEYVDWILANPKLMDDYADLLMYTLPLPRYQWYEPSNFDVIK